jgi:hypothetical protein
LHEVATVTELLDSALLLELLTELLDTGSSELALLPESPPHAVKAKATNRIIMDPIARRAPGQTVLKIKGWIVKN